VKFLAAVLALAACHHDVTKRDVVEATRTAVVKRGDVADRVLLTGEVKAVSAADLTVPRTDNSQLTIRWMAEDGSLVKTGDKVLEFDNSAVTQQLEEKHLALLEAEMGFRTASDLAAIEADNKHNELEQHQIAYQKAKIKAEIPADLISKRDYQEHQLDKKRMEIAVKKAEADASSQAKEAELDLRVKQIELDKAKRVIDNANKTLEELVLKAPRDGIVVINDHPWMGTKLHVGDVVEPGMSVISMPNLSVAMEVHSELSDVDDGRVQIGNIGTCTLDAYPDKPTACTVTELTPVARTKGETSLRRAFAVKLSLASADAEHLRPGMSVKVVMVRPTLKSVLVVPRGAIVFDGKAPHVRTPKGLVEISLASGACDAQGCAVDKGVAEGDTVVIGGGS
jgi:multidrug efflux pump subunit AcrA (membrane-fusion protein)